jgi:pimeloyl-ACP methyl ester carboxylesterase
MVQERLAELVELRPGRSLFCRHWVLGEEAANTSNSSSNTINLVCIHGTAASESQFLPLLRSLETKLLPTSNSISNSNNLSSILCWMYDAVGCGQSPALGGAEAYVDAEQVKDLQALLTNHVNLDLPTYFLGHSYGPNWIYKCLQSSSDSPSPTLMNVAGLILMSTGVRNAHLQNGGPGLFKLPLWLLNCLQPLLTQSFLKLGFAPHTHSTNPELVQEAKRSNNGNDMQVICHYYRAHGWVEDGTIAFLKNEKNYRMLVLHGVQDGIIPIEHGQELANQLGIELSSIDNASHMVLVEQPDEISERIWIFLDQK